MKNFDRNFTRCIDAGLPIIYVDAIEDGKVKADIRRLCQEMDREVVEWNLLGSHDRDNPNHDWFPNYGKPLSDFLDTLLDEPDLRLDNKVIVLSDAHRSLAEPTLDPLAVACLEVIAQRIVDGSYDCNICIVAPLITLPVELENAVTVLEPDSPDEADIRNQIITFAAQQEIARPEKDLLDKLVTRLKGLTQSEIDNILALAVAENGRIDASDLPRVLEQKQQTIKKSGILEMVPVRESMEDIGGLENLKAWLKRKSAIFRDIQNAQTFGVDIPKGVLIAGMPGCGKSLTAKAAAREFDVPLLRLDMGRLMGKYVGESEANMRRAIKLTEASSPCVLWIDELEKAFAGIGDGGSEVTKRLFGSFLTWMQEKESLAFVVATANKIDQLPPELLRKGRFDEVFYVKLPNLNERKKIIEIHIKKRRGDNVGKINIDQLAQQTEGYCGADLEGIVREGIETAFLNKKSELATADILDAIKNVSSLKEIMGKSLDAMEKTYRELKLKSASAD